MVGAASSQSAALFTLANCLFISEMRAGSPQPRAAEIPVQDDSAFQVFLSSIGNHELRARTLLYCLFGYV